MRQLVLAVGAGDAERAFRRGWSRWQRAHQAVARRCHSARRARERDALGAPPPAAASACENLTDAEWARVQLLLPPLRPPVGRRCYDHRTVLGGILWVLRTTVPWCEMPARFGKWDTAYARYRLWCKQGLWQRIIDALGPKSAPL